MKRLSQYLLSALILTSVVITGCARGPAERAAADRLKYLEARNGRLEDDVRTAAAERDALRKRLVTSDAEIARFRRNADEVQATIRERDELKKQLQSRTVERDVALNQFEALRGNLRDLLGKNDSPRGSAGEEATAAPQLAN